MIKLDISKLDKEFKRMENEMRKKVRRTSRRAIASTIRELKKDQVAETPKDTGALSKSYKVYSNIDKTGYKAYGVVYIDKNTEFRVLKNKKNKRTSKKITKKTVKLKTDIIKKPYNYAYSVEGKKRFLKSNFDRNKDKYAEMYIRIMSEFLNEK